MFKVDCVVVGAGVVGLAIGRSLAQSGRETLVLERHDAFGTETSARNSEVIHAGIYYAAGSLKARMCVPGRKQLYEYCRQKGIEHRRYGKLIVAADETQARQLDEIAAAAARNGVDDLRRLDAAEALQLEPALRCTAALLSPSTGIVDSHGLMLALLGDIEQAGGSLVLQTPVTALRPDRDGVVVATGPEASDALQARWVINAAGLEAPQLVYRIEGFPAEHAPRARYAKGNYFTLEGRAPFSRLVYPVPEPGGLGVHLTLDLAGRARFGPDVEWIDWPEYSVDPRRADAFYARIRRYWPALPDGALSPAYSGVRPKIEGPDGLAADFRIDGPAVHGVPGIINLLGIESPGLTVALAIGDYVAAIVQENS
jgi:L-2-hydroxyglutarate oxidase LhgO